MRQYQIIYENREKLDDQLLEIRRACGETPFSDVIFYLSWTKSAQTEIESVTASIESFFPDSAYYGNEASGNISMGEFTYGVNIACYVFESASTKTELVWVEKGTAVSSLEELWSYCRNKKDLCGIELIPAISSLEELGIDRNIPAVDPDILIFGGASVNYDDAAYGADIIAKGHPMTRTGMAVMLYFGRELHFHSTDVLGWKGLGKLMEVTASSGKVIREIDHVPAYSVYEKYLNLTVEDRDTLVFPLIAEEDGNEFIRTPQIIQQDKSMLMFATVPEGSRVQISYGDKNTILNSLNDKAAEIAAYRPDAIKAYSCAARRLFWGDEEVGRETEVLQNLAPVCGFYTGGEILRFGRTLRVLNQTLAVVSFREGEGKKIPDEKALRHSEDKSLLSRLTYFAEKIVEEEKAQRMLAEGFESSFKALYQVMYYVNMSEGKVQLLYGDEEAKKFMPIANVRSMDELLDNFYRYYVDSLVEPEDRDKVKGIMNGENIRRALRDSSSVSVNYRVRRNLVDPVYTEMSVIRAAEEDGELSAIILAFRLTDEELRSALETQKKMEEDARIIGALSEDFGCVDYVGIDGDEAGDVSVQVRSSELLRRILPEWELAESFYDKLELMTDRLAYEPDREAFRMATRREKLLTELKESDTYYINIRLVIEGEVRYYQMKVSAVRDGGVLTGFVAGTRSVDENTRKDLETRRVITESLEKAETETRRTDLLYDVTKTGRWTYELTPDDKVISARYADRTERQIDIYRENDAMAWVNTLHPDDRERVKAEFMAAVCDHSGSTPYDTTFRILGRDGKYLWGRSSGKVLRHEDGSGEFIGMSMDITDQMEEQRKRLLGTMALSNDVLSKANIGLWAFELDEGQPPRMYDDETMLGLVGLEHQVPPEEAYHVWYDNIDEGSYDLVNDAVAKMMAGEHAEVQYPWHYPDGRTIMVRCGGVRNFEYTKGIRIEGTHQNVTQTLHFDEEERKRAKQTANDLLISQLRADSLAFISDNEPDLDSAINFFGKRILEIFGCDQVVFRETDGHRIVLNAPGITDVPLEVCSGCPFVHFGNDSVYGEDGVVLMNDCSAGFDGTMTHPDCPSKSSFMQRIYSGGELVGLFSIHYLNERHTFSENETGIMKVVAAYLGIFIGRVNEKEAEIARIQAESSNKAKTEFLFNMSHDIRTPMNAILGYTNIAIRHADEPEKVNESLKKIKVSGGHLLSLINDILEMSRIEAGRLEITDAPLDMREAFEGIKNMSQALAVSKEIDFRAVFRNVTNPYVYADELHTNQVIINLISNAVKYTGHGGRVEYLAEQIAEPAAGIARYRFTVTDTGIGMSEEFQKHLFENFSRENDATVSKQEGAGLGLAIVKRITDLAGGTIAVRSRKGEGSTFIVEMPFRIMDEAEIERFEAGRSRDEISSDYNFKGRRVLLAEDNEMNREIATEILEEAGLIVETAEDGEAAVKAVAEKGVSYYDFILMDIQMPFMNGYEATKAIRTLPGGGRIPIIALSANAFEEDRKKSREAGMNDHVAKPIKIEELFASLAKFM